MVSQRTVIISTEFDSSDEEDFECDQATTNTPLHIGWLDLSFTGCCPHLIGISGLPGCKFREIRRNIHYDIEYLNRINILNVFILCTKGEMLRCRVPQLLNEYEKVGIGVHHYPMHDDKIPSMQESFNIIEELKECINNGSKALIHCVAGLGRSCLIACMLLLVLDDVTPEDVVIQKMRQIRGPAAIQTVKQFNFINEFREKYKQYQKTRVLAEAPPRSVSRCNRVAHDFWPMLKHLFPESSNFPFTSFRKDPRKFMYIEYAEVGDPQRSSTKPESSTGPSKDEASSAEDKEIFRVAFNVDKFKPSEIKIQAADDGLIVEGERESKGDSSHSASRFVRYYSLPSELDSSTIKSRLSREGILTIEAQKIAKKESNGPWKSVDIEVEGKEEKKDEA